MLTICHSTLAAAIVAVCGVACATPEEAKARLEASAQALAEINTFTAEVVHGGTGQFADMMASGEGRLIAVRPPVEDASAEVPPFQVRVTGVGRMAKSKPDLNFDVVRRGNVIEWLEHDQKALRVRTERQARHEQVRVTREMVPGDIFGPEPFARQMADGRISLEEPVSVDGVLCDVVKVPQGNTSRFVLYYLGQDDHLPRRVEQTYSMGGAAGAMFTEFRAIKVNEPVDLAKASLELPEGYTRENEPGQAPPVTPNMIQEQGMDKGADPGLVTTAPGAPLQVAADWELKDADGKTVKLSDLRGNVVVLDFWGTWCAPCLKAAPEVQALHEAFLGQPVKVLGLNFREKDPQKAIDHMREHNYTFGLLLGADQVVRDYRVRVFPTYYVIGFDGEVVHIEDGYKAGQTFGELNRVITEYLGSREEGSDEARAASEQAQQ